MNRFALLNWFRTGKLKAPYDVLLTLLIVLIFLFNLDVDLQSFLEWHQDQKFRKYLCNKISDPLICE